MTTKYRAPAKFKGYMLDRHEQPRATFDGLSGFSALVVRAIADPSQSRMLTSPIFLGFSDSLLINGLSRLSAGRTRSETFKY